MTYLTIAKITQSSSLRQRLTACAAQEKKAEPYAAWVDAHIWDIAIAPGWADKWQSAVAGDIADPGAHEGVITDGDILAVVQGLT